MVATLGTTTTGAVDPLAEIVALRRRHRFRLHVDASYGGYFGLADNLDADTRRAFEAADAADSIVIDPHKHGLQPYGCGCVRTTTRPRRANTRWNAPVPAQRRSRCGPRSAYCRWFPAAPSPKGSLPAARRR